MAVSALVRSLLSGPVHIAHFLARFEDEDLVDLLQKLDPQVLNDVVLRLDRARLRRLLAITSGGLIFPLSGDALSKVADTIRMGDADRFGVFVFMKLLEDPALSQKVIRKLSSADWRALAAHMPAEEFGRLVLSAPRLARRRLDREAWAAVLAGIGPQKASELVADTYDPAEAVRILGFEMASVLAEHIPELAEFLPEVAADYLDATGDYERVAQVFERWGVSLEMAAPWLGPRRTYHLWTVMDGVQVPPGLLASWVKETEPWEVPLEFVKHLGIAIPHHSPLYPYAVLLGFEDGDVLEAVLRVGRIPEDVVEDVVRRLESSGDVRAIDILKKLGRHRSCWRVIKATGAWVAAYPDVVAYAFRDELAEIVASGAGDAVVRAGRLEELPPQLAAMALLAYAGEPVEVSPGFAVQMLGAVDDVEVFKQLLARVRLSPEVVLALRGNVPYTWLALAADAVGPEVLKYMPDVVLIAPSLLRHALSHFDAMPSEVKAMLICAGYVKPERIPEDVLRYIPKHCLKELMG